MIRSLTIQHFKAIEQLTVPLGPITVLIGPNDSGKSTILQALMALSRAGEKEQLGVEALLGCPAPLAATDRQLASDVRFAAAGSTSLSGTPREYRYELAITPHAAALTEEIISLEGNQLLVARRGQLISTSGNRSSEYWQGGATNLSALAVAREESAASAIAQDLRTTLVRLDPRAIARPCPLGTPLGEDGTGLVGIVDDLLTSGIGDETIAKANTAVRKLSPHVKGVAAKLHRSGGKELHFALRSGLVVPASQISDGVVLAAALVVIALASGSRRLLIEEPENGLHPRQLGIVADTIREIATQHGTQVVLTTHSPLLLNHFGAEETLLVTRSADTGVQVQQLSRAQGLDDLASEMSLGELWYNVGDQALARPA